MSPRLDNVRTNDVDVYERNGVMHVRANGKGISLLTEQERRRLNLAGCGSYRRTRPCLRASLSIPTVRAISLYALLLI
jgi:hypothetical protein